jgi:hypothetical protein
LIWFVNLADSRGPNRRRSGPNPKRISSCYIKALRSPELGSRFGAYSQGNQRREAKARRNHHHTASHRLQQQPKREERHRLGDPGRRTDQAEPIGVVFRSEDRERQRSARDGENAVAGAVQQGEARRGAAAEDADDAGADRMGDTGQPRPTSGV